MINFDEIFKKCAISKKEVAQKLKVEQSNVNSKLRKFNKNLSEVEEFLALFNTSLGKEIEGEERAQQRHDAQREVSGYVNIPVAVFNVISSQSETILSQQRVIETISFQSKKAKSA